MNLIPLDQVISFLPPSVTRFSMRIFFETNNVDKVFNPGILIHDNLFEVTIQVTPDKNVKKTTNASLILEDFNPPLYELPFHKEVPGIAPDFEASRAHGFVLRSL
ncbi:hypothetical protein Tco_0147923, partial [Tanacetum coccineum]